MTKTQIKQAEQFLDSRYLIAVDTDKRMGNEQSDEFLPNNPDFIYYKGAVKMIENLGGNWTRNKYGLHIISL